MSTARPSELSRTSEVVAKYGDAQKFLDRFNPSWQLRCHKDLDLVVKNSGVSMRNMANAYGEDKLKFWLELQVSELGKVFKGVDDEAVQALAKMIYASRPDLKCAEVMAFLGGVSLGEYGEIYGFDVYQIIRLLPNFIARRNECINRMEQEERKRRDEEHKKNCITYEEYKRLRDE